MTLLLLLLCLVHASFQLDCSTANKTFNGDVVWRLTSDELDPKSCQYFINVTNFRVPTLTISNITLTGTNSIRISQHPDLFSNSSDILIDSEASHNEQIVLQMRPLGFLITFNVSNDSKDDQFKMALKFDTISPQQNITIPVVDSGALLDSEDIPANSFIHVGDGQSNLQVRLVIFNETLDHVALRNFYLYSYDYGNEKFLGTVDDAVVSNKSLGFNGGVFEIINRNSFAVGGFSFLAGRTMETDTPIRTLSSQNSSESLTASGKEYLFFYEVSNPNINPSTPINIHDVHFNGTGQMTIFAACVGHIDEFSPVAAVINASNFQTFENLAIHGRCRAYQLINGTISWKKTISDEGVKTNQVGDQGVVMSYGFPYPEKSNYTVSQAVKGPKDGDLISVRYDIQHLDQGIEVFIGDEKISMTEDPYFESITSLTILGKSPQQVRFNVSQGSTGVLMRYTLESSVKSSGALFTFGAILTIVINNLYLN